ncbi:hypothetical protein DRN67_02070 [Candidatus Micrarchaeota archaeon]|nr:MAG: hypothetical protein DRN67_02070 [Candidatus Micrarchaeota archaeon]
MRGFVFTLDAVAASAFLIAMLSLLFLLASIEPTQRVEEHFAADVLAVIGEGELNVGEIKQLFLISNKCGSIVIRNEGGDIIEGVSACGCQLGTEKLAYRTAARLREVDEGESELELFTMEARVCERVQP